MDPSNQSGINQPVNGQQQPSGRKFSGKSVIPIAVIGLVALGIWFGVRSSSQVPQIATAKTSTSMPAKKLVVNPTAVTQKILITQVPVSQSLPLSEKDFSYPLPDGSRIVLFDPTSNSGVTVNVTKDFSSAGKPSLSFDGSTFLFLGRKKHADPIGVWEMSVDGRDARNVTDCGGECLDVLYLSTMYTLDAEKPVDLIAFISRKDKDMQPQLFTCKLDGSDRRQITFSPTGVSDPCLLSDGRLLITMPTKNDIGTTQTNTNNTSFYVINTDGTDLFPFAGFHQASTRRSSPVEAADGRVYYLEAKNQGDPRSPLIVSVDRKRSLRSRLDEKTVGEGQIFSLAAMPYENLIVSYEPTSSTEKSAGIYLFEKTGDERLTKVFDDDAWHELDVQVIYTKSKPPGRSSVVNNKTDVGQLYCLDAYVNDVADELSTKKNKIHRVRLYTSDISANSSPRMLGDVPVETDGSFYLEIPARTPLRLETLTQSGDVIRSMQNWFWVMPMERRGCIGCHEDRELTPPNRHVNALRKLPHRIGTEASPSMKQYEEGH